MGGMAEPIDKIAEATERCFIFAMNNEPAKEAAADFLALLRGGRSWSDSEIDEVHRRVLDRLRRRAVEKDAS